MKKEFEIEYHYPKALLEEWVDKIVSVDSSTVSYVHTICGGREHG